MPEPKDCLLPAALAPPHTLAPPPRAPPPTSEATSESLRQLYLKSVGVSMTGGWRQLAGLIDGTEASEPPRKYEPKDITDADNIVTEEVELSTFGMTGPTAVPLFEGGEVLMRLGSPHKTFKIYG